MNETVETYDFDAEVLTELVVPSDWVKLPSGNYINLANVAMVDVLDPRVILSSGAVSSMPTADIHAIGESIDGLLADSEDD